MKIDAHVHAIDAGFDENGKQIRPLFPCWRGTDPQAIIERSRGMGVVRAVQVDPPEIVFETHEAFGDYIVPIPQIRLDKETPEDIDELFKRGAKGIKFIAPAHPYGDDRYFKHYQAVADNHGLAVFHTGYLLKVLFEPGGILERDTYTDISCMRPVTLDRIARAFPELKIMMAHFGNPWWEEARLVLNQNKNIYADLSGGTAYKRDMEMWRQIFAPNGLLDVNTFGKLCFATDGEPFMPSYEQTIKTFNEFHDRLYKLLKVPNEIIEKIEYENMNSLLE